jgi:hypothetical protein
VYCVAGVATSAAQYTRPTHRPFGPPPINKTRCRTPYAATQGLTLLMIGVNAETCRAKGTSIKYFCCIKLVLHIISCKRKFMYGRGLSSFSNRNSQGFARSESQPLVFSSSDTITKIQSFQALYSREICH